MRLLLAEDDPLIGDGIRTALTLEGYAIDWVQDGQAAATALQAGQYDLMILDLGLPKRSGLEVLKELRAHGDDLPVLILTARDTTQDRITGLDTGADDYLVKPFDLDELSARLRALARRSTGRASPQLSIGPVSIDPITHTVTLEGRAVDISPREFSILQTLMENAGKVISRARLEESMYGWNEEVESNAVEVHIHHLRKKLGTKYIRTLRGVGYIIDKTP